MPHRKVRSTQNKAVNPKGSHQPKLLLSPKRRLSRPVLANHPISHPVLPHHNLKDHMRITLIPMVLRTCRQRRPGRAHRTVIPLLNLLRNHRRASDLRMEVDRAVRAGMVMFHPQYMGKHRGMTTKLEGYSISSRIWVLGLGREYSNMHTL